MEENKEKTVIDNPTDTLFGERRRIAELSAASEEELKKIVSEENAFGEYEEENDISTEEITSRTLSPGILVLKRFFRSKLSMTGLIMLVVLFIFSFLGPLLPFGFIWGERTPDESQAVVEEYYKEGESPVYGDMPVYIITYS